MVPGIDNQSEKATMAAAATLLLAIPREAVHIGVRTLPSRLAGCGAGIRIDADFDWSPHSQASYI